MVTLGSSLSDEDILLIKEKLRNLENQQLDKFQRNIKALSYITYLCQKNNILPILVGGHAVELYTAGHYSTVDIDLVLSGYEEAGKIFEALGFHKKERHFYHEKLHIPIEIPSSILEGSMNKVIEVTVESGFSVFVIGIEDLILDRIRAAVYWNSPRDKEWAYLMMGAHKSNIDYLYLEKTAQQETSAKIYELVLELKNQIANENQT